MIAIKLLYTYLYIFFGMMSLRIFCPAFLLTYFEISKSEVFFKKKMSIFDSIYKIV